MRPILTNLALCVAVAAVTACSSSKTSGTAGQTLDKPSSGALSSGAAAAPDDSAIEVPPSGYWERKGPGSWRYDLGVRLRSDIQLTARGDSRGLVRVALPPGASRAQMTRLTVVYAKNPVEMAEAPGAASGSAIWHVHADEGGEPGARLGGMEVIIDDASAAALEEFGDGSVHQFETPLEVPATFWLVFERTSGDPRVAAMRLTTGKPARYKDLYFLESPDSPLGEAVKFRPYLAIEFEGMSR